MQDDKLYKSHYISKMKTVGDKCAEKRQMTFQPRPEGHLVLSRFPRVLFSGEIKTLVPCPTFYKYILNIKSESKAYKRRLQIIYVCDCNVSPSGNLSCYKKTCFHFWHYIYNQEVTTYWIRVSPNPPLVYIIFILLISRLHTSEN